MKATKAQALLAALRTLTVPVATAAHAWAKPKGALSQIHVVDDSCSMRQQVGLRLKGLIIDVNMPNMDGLTMVKNLRSAGAKTPVVMMSNEGSATTSAAAKAAGANGPVVKPFKPDQFVAAVMKLAR